MVGILDMSTRDRSDEEQGAVDADRFPLQLMRCPCRRRTQIVLQEGRHCCTGHGCQFGVECRTGFPLWNQTPVLIFYDGAEVAGPCSVLDPNVEVSLRSDAQGMELLAYEAEAIREMHAFCAALLQQVRPAAKRPRVLVIGAGERPGTSSMLWPNDQVCRVGVEIYPAASVDYVAYVHHLPFADHTFDGVWIQSALRHLRQPGKVVDEVHRVLRDGGIVFADMSMMQSALGEMLKNSRACLHSVMTGHSCSAVEQAHGSIEWRLASPYGLKWTMWVTDLHVRIGRILDSVAVRRQAPTSQ